MAEGEHKCFSVSTTAYMQNFNADNGPTVYAVHYEEAPRRNEDGSTTYSLILPTLIVSAYMAEPQKIAERVAELLNANWDDRARDLTAAAQLERSGLITREKYNHIVENIRARDRMREAMA